MSLPGMRGHAPTSFTGNPSRSCRRKTGVMHFCPLPGKGSWNEYKKLTDFVMRSMIFYCII